jgi:hypothetical protein
LECRHNKWIFMISFLQYQRWCRLKILIELVSAVDNKPMLP